MSSQALDAQTVACMLVTRWGIHVDLAVRLLLVADALPFDIWIFSGARTRRQQLELEEAGRPAAPWELSTHADLDRRGCPRQATGADVQPVSVAIRSDRSAVWTLGRAATEKGLRWGGGSATDENGLPVDRWHFDLGPRTD